MLASCWHATQHEAPAFPERLVYGSGSKISAYLPAIFSELVVSPADRC